MLSKRSKTHFYISFILFTSNGNAYALYFDNNYRVPIQQHPLESALTGPVCKRLKLILPNNHWACVHGKLFIDLAIAEWFRCARCNFTMNSGAVDKPVNIGTVLFIATYHITI